MARGPVQSQSPEGQDAYGFHPGDPVRVGYGDRGIMAFFELLRGPEGQRVAWRRLGPHSGTGVETFEVTYEGLGKSVRMYIDPNHGAAIHAPEGFIIQGLTSRAPTPAEEKPEVIEL
ncbi:fibril protein [Pyxidicoccus fallax]|uniref:Fibril protein n=1 Tax=Pyxidicoccus fallax TaxID=394095 RepID=A0A848LZF7_9BACT|nr:fibril protein [Pyxidicoccus fallax]NPC84837.1 fibril protein [Pyxidicoccus fallax]